MININNINEYELCDANVYSKFSLVINLKAIRTSRYKLKKYS